MIRFYFNAAPNPMKVALLLEELGLPYQGVPVDTRKGEQFVPAYLQVNPNGKVPALVDGEAVIFDSNAILLYLADKAGRFVPPVSDAVGRGEMLSWLMFVASGIGPFSGQSVHFRHAALDEDAFGSTTVTRDGDDAGAQRGEHGRVARIDAHLALGSRKRDRSHLA